MKKLLSFVLCLSILCTACACSKNEPEKTTPDDETDITEEVVVTTTTSATTAATTTEETTETTVQMTLNERMDSIVQDTIKFWDEVLDPLKSYAEDGTDNFGNEIDMDEFIKNMEIYYKKLVEDKEFLDGLGDEHKDAKSVFDGLFVLATNVYNSIKAEKPEPEKKLPFKSDIDMYDKLLDHFMDVVIENYPEEDEGGSDEDYDDYGDDDDEDDDDDE